MKKGAQKKPVRKHKEEPLYRMRLPRALWLIPPLILLGMLAVAGTFVLDEMRTSRLQSEWIANYDKQIGFEMRPGPNTVLHYPADGPYNQRLGYSYLPFYIKALAGDDYTVNSQARSTIAYRRLLAYGLYPVYRAKSVTGLALYDHDGQPIYSASYPTRIFAAFDSIPPLLIHTLLFIENRELLREGPATRNPAIEWKRFLFAAFGHALEGVVPNLNAGGGSTLATQIEKFRYSPGGETHGAADKLRQVASASFRAYLDGPDTREMRKQIALDYLNSTPLGARPGFGEINSIGDGLWAWFGIDLNEATTALNLPDTDPDSLRTKARVYRTALGLVLAQRRPSYYLAGDRGALDDLIDLTLDKLESHGVISPALRDATKAATLKFLPEPPAPQEPPYIEQKAANALRTHLLGMLGIKKLYELDRLDLAARTTLDQPTQKKTVEFLKKMGDRKFLESIGLYGFRLLDPDNDPKKIKWSVVLYERGPGENKIRVQADNVDEPFDMNEGMKLDLGSTAKLRTMVTYLEITGELYRRYAGLSADDLRDMTEEAPDPLTSWATTWLIDHPKATLEDMLNGAMDRKYSGNPGEAFFTGGGVHHFENFEKEENYQMWAVRDAFRESVNLAFIRIMRDIVNYTIGQGAQTKQELLEDPDQPARQAYLERFADQEGSLFLNRYISDYENLTPDQVLDKLATHGHKGATARTIMFRSARPEADFAAYAAFMVKHPVKEELGEARLRELYGNYPAERYSLADRAYIAGVNPLELWLTGYLQANPHATRSAILTVSRPVRIESYAWLFHPRLKRAQDSRIRTILEEDAFEHIQKRWARLGYPFERLVPSLATAIGCSADRPGALAELVGIILNEGTKKPTARFESLQFGYGTPYQTLLIHNGAHEQNVLDPAITKTVKTAMITVIENGTAKRAKGSYLDASGQPYQIGGKTGTGDHRFDEFAAGGRLISSRVVNRTGTLAFFIGDKFFGTITAHVAGEEAADYRFTSALSAQMLKSLAPVLSPLINGTKAEAQGETQKQP